MPEHKMVTIDGVRYRPEDAERARARAGAARAGALTVADAHLPGSGKDTDPDGQGDGDVGGFDPAEHTILQVMAHLAEADEDETARVLDLEAKAEKPRTGLIDRRAELLEEARKRASGGGAR